MFTMLTSTQDGNILGICDKIKTLDGAGAAKVFKRDLLSQ
jgi:hypothetical protein